MQTMKFSTSGGALRAQRTQTAQRALQAAVESLEMRRLFTTIMVTSLEDNTTVDNQVTLREAIEASMTHASVDGSAIGTGQDTINFDPALAGKTIYLKQVDDTTFGPSALDVATLGPDRTTLYIDGGKKGITIARDPSVANLRLFHLLNGAGLGLSNLTLKDGHAQGGDGGSGLRGGGGGAGMGGAIFNEGNLLLDHTSVMNNTAQGGNGGNAVVAAKGDGSGGGPNGGLVNSDGGLKGGFGGGSAGGAAGGFGGGGSNIYVSDPPTGFGGGNGGSDIGSAGGGGGGFGGAIFNSGRSDGQASFSIVNSTLTGNTTTGGNGGTSDSVDAAGSPDTDTASGDGGSGAGGAIFNVNSTANGGEEILFSTLTGNDVIPGRSGNPRRFPGTYAGPALYNLAYDLGSTAQTSEVWISNSILDNGFASIENQLLSSDPLDAATLNFAAPCIIGNFIFTGYVQQLSHDDVVGFANLIDSASGLDPAGLANHGGPTQTIGLLSDSKAIDAGDDSQNSIRGLTTDQRGGPFKRVFGVHSDLGAFERQPYILSAVKPVFQNAKSGFKAIDFSGQYNNPDGKPLSIIKFIDLPTHGSLSLVTGALAPPTPIVADTEIGLNQVQFLKFNPDANYIGPDAFTWKGSDGTAFTADAVAFGLNVKPHDVLTPTGVLITTTEAKFFSGAAAYFTSDNTSLGASAFFADVDWGDGADSGGTVSQDSAGHFKVLAGHTYKEQGHYGINVFIHDRAGFATIAHSNANIADAAISASGRSFGARVNQQFTQTRGIAGGCQYAQHQSA